MRPFDPRLLRAARSTRRHLAIVVILGVLTALVVVGQAEILARSIAAAVSGGASRRDLATELTILAGLVAARSAINGFQDGAAHRAAARIKRELRRQLVAHASRRAAGEPVDRAATAMLATRGIDGLDAYVGRYLPQLVLAAIVPVIVIARLATVSILAAVTVAVTLPLIPVFMVLIGRATGQANERRWSALAWLSHHFLDVVSGMVTLKVFGRARAQAESVRQSTDQYRRTTMSTLRIAFLSSLVLELLATLSVALVAVEVGLRLVGGGLDLHTGLLIIILAPEAYLPLRLVGAEYHAAVDGITAMGAVFEILERPEGRRRGTAPVPPLGPGSAISVTGLRVVHPGRARPAPDGLDVVARHGLVTALVGPSGTGKSTVLAVLLGLRDPDDGDVQVLGTGPPVQLGDLDPDRWREQVAWVDQQPYVFAGTVADNVRVARPTASDAELRAALQDAGLAGWTLDRALDGGALSAGERRRLAMARALVRAAPVVLLDEPTAGLDESTEAALLATVRQLAADAIVVLVTHRPAAAAAADVVVHVQTPVPAGAGGP